MPVQPAYPCPVCRIEDKVENDAALTEPLFNCCDEVVDSFPADGRDEHRALTVRLTLGEISQPGALFRFEPVDLVPDFDQRAPSPRLNAELSQHALNIVRLRFAVGVR